LAGLILAAGTVELSWALRRVRSGRFAIGLVYLGLAAGFLVGAATLPREKLAFLYLVVAGFDGFSEVFGRLAGRTKLARTISPGKTAEGAVAGGAGALILAAVARTIAGLPVSLSILLGAAIAVAALSGDLAASWVKRRAGIKNYSAIIPGHGGVLDRFDSFIGAGAAAGIATCVMPGLYRQSIRLAEYLTG
jgi:phosphatidate cytidylyltransferase